MRPYSSYYRYQLVNDQQAVYRTEYLNSLTLGGLPLHTLNIKVGAPVMLLANTDLARGHCNGTRYIVRHITAHIAYSMRRKFRRCWMNQFLRTGQRATVRRVRRGCVEIHTVCDSDTT